ncbi:MAG: class I SAM-dependent methyltransferase [Verrucomicrobiae bacterium]|nr:class I SAM-dependent methyltransferase [Verrucomicrobiae bacterium]
MRTFSAELLECPGCGVLASVEEPQDLRAHYSETFYTEEEGERFRFGLESVIKCFRRARFRRLMRWGPYRRVLDVGTDRGWFLKFFQDAGAEVFGTQMSAPAARAASRRLGREIFLGDLPDARFPAASMDLVCLYNVLEHVREPRVYLREINRVLRPGGVLVIEAPNARCVTARLFGRHWLGWDIPNHLHHFNPASLRALLERHGFTVLKESHWSVEFGPFHILQTVLNALGLPRNQLYRLIQREELRRDGRAPAVVCAMSLLLAALLAAPCGLLSLLLSLCRQGEVFRFYCRKSAAVDSG